MTIVLTPVLKKSAFAALAAVRSKKKADEKADTAPRDALLPRIAGLGLAGAGIAHFITPELFRPITEPVFPENTTQWTYSNGATETLVGLAIANKRTRTLGYVGLAGYVGFLAVSALK